MAFVPFPNGYACEVVGELLGKVCENTFWFEYLPELGDAPTLLFVAEHMRDWYVSEFLPALSTSYVLLRSVCTLPSGRTPPSVTVPISGAAGGIGGAPHPANVTYRINLQVQSPPGRRRGCLFVPGIPTAVTVGNVVDAGWRLDWRDPLGHLQDLARSWHLQWVVASKYLNGAPRPTVEPWRIDFIRTDRVYVGQRRSRLHNEPVL